MALNFSRPSSMKPGDRFTCRVCLSEQVAGEYVASCELNHVCHRCHTDMARAKVDDYGLLFTLTDRMADLERRLALLEKL